MIKTFQKSVNFALSLFCLLQLQVSAQISCPGFLWGRSNENLSQSGHSDGKSVATDSQGNVYASGVYKDTLTLGTFTLLSPNNNNYNVYIAKFSPDGTCEWANSTTGSGAYAKSIALDNNGNVYVSGSFDGTTSFGTQILTANVGSDIFVSKLDPQGQWIWTKSAASPDADYVSAFEVDEQGNSYIAAKFDESFQFGNIALPALPQEGFFIAKLDPLGTWEWAKSELIHETLFLKRLQVTGQTVNLSGYFQGEMEFGNFNLSSAGGEDVFLAKMDLDGVWTSAIQWGGTGNEYAEVILDEEENMYIVGYNYGTPATIGNVTLTSTGSIDSYAFKLNAQGDILWHKEITGPNFQNIYAAALDENQNLYLTGGIYLSSVFGQYTLDSPNGEDVFIAKLNSDGEWCGLVQAIGSMQADYSQSIAVHDSANIYITGSFSGTIDFNNILTGNGNGLRCFVSKCSIEPAGLNLEVTQSGATLHAKHENAAYQWIHCDGNPVPGASQQDFTIPANGSYAVIVTECGKSDTSACFTINNLEIYEQENTFFSVFPNPADDQLNLVFQNQSVTSIYTIADLSGKLYLKGQILDASSAIDIQHLSAGMYLLQVKTADQSAMHYFVKK